MLTVVEFLDTVKKKIKINNEGLLVKAFNFASEAHKNQKRDSGDPYFIHPISVALGVLDYKLDENCVISALLHDTIEDTNVTLDDIKNNFNQEIANIVDGLTKIGIIKNKSRLEKNIENFRKLILSTAKDIRVLIIKLMDRLDNLRTIDGIQNEERRKRIANETLIIFVPLAERIGMYKLRLELEDLCFKVLLPNERENIIRDVKKVKKNQKYIIDNVLKVLKLKIIFENNLNCKIFGREKRPYSIWKKMQKKSISFDKLKDIIAFRIIVKELQDCYKVLGIINSNYLMIPDTFKDYINKPKSNGYQSLHIVIAGPKNVKIEIQIRTEEMDRIAEYGIASHWMYKQNIKQDTQLQEYNNLRDLVQNIESGDYNYDKYEDLKYEIYEDEIFCYTPNGDIINLPIGSTGIDFAFAIHEDIGSRCSGVKINGVISQLRTQLNSGDDVEILTSKNIQINEDWLNYVKTSKARNKIKKYIRQTRQEEFEAIGRNDIANISKELNIEVNDKFLEKNLNKFNNIKSVEQLYVMLGIGKILKNDFIKTLFPDLKKKQAELIFEKKKEYLPNSKDSNIKISGLDKNVVYKFAKCCYPIPPNKIVGVVNTGIGITIHRKDCKTLKTIKNEKIIDLDWEYDQNNKYITKLSLILDGIPGVLAKITNICAEKEINIIALTTNNESHSFQDIELKVEVKNMEELNNLKASFRGIKGVIEII